PSRYFLVFCACSGLIGYSFDLKGFAPGFCSMCMPIPARLTAPFLNMASLKAVGNPYSIWARKLFSTILTAMVATDKLSLLGKDIHDWPNLFGAGSFSTSHSPKRLYGN